jgi:hypothetical protein
MYFTHLVSVLARTGYPNLIIWGLHSVVVIHADNKFLASVEPEDLYT